MEYIFKQNIDVNEYHTFIENAFILSFMQDDNWALVKDGWKSFRPGLYQDGKLVATCLFLIRHLSMNIFMGYIPRGYVMNADDEEVLSEFTKGIKALAKKEKCYTVKIDPNFCFQENRILLPGGEESGNIPITFSKYGKKCHTDLLRLHYRHTGFSKSISETLQPRYHMMIPLVDYDLKPLTEEEVFQSFRKKTRSRLGNYHVNRGVFFEHTNDISKIDDFIKVLSFTEQRQEIQLRNKDYFTKLMESYKENAVLFFGKLDLDIYLSFLEKGKGNEEKIKKVKALMEEEGKILILSAALVIMPTNQTGVRVSEYLYAGNRFLFNELEISLGLVYDICKYSIQNHCTYCNLGGVDGNLQDHLSVFKSKFNPVVMEFIGEYDLPIRKFLYYPIDFFFPILKKGYTFFRRKK